MFEKILSGVLAVSLTLGSGIMMPKVADAQLYADAAVECTSYSGTNVNAQNYTGNWASIIGSYLVDCGNGVFMKVQSGAVNGKLTVEYYDADHKLLESKHIDVALPLFGGFYADDDGYYVLSGQNNKNEDDNVEVYRITKYDFDWNELGHDSLFGANTYIAFRAGTARMTSSDGYLLIRTCHEMYMSEDGKHHQANVTIQVDTDTMEITDSFTSIMNSDYGYISHSFNQFIEVDGTNVVAVDHGDANPRSIALIKYNTDFTSGMFSPTTMSVFSMGNYSKCDVVDMLSLSGADGANYTGATVGGFEMSDSKYIVAGSSIDQSAFYSAKTKNIFVSTINKKLSGKAEVRYITDYAEGSESPSNPHLVKISDDEFMLMWSLSGKIYYVKLDGEGNTVDEINVADGALSDCAPIVSDGKLMWYTWTDDENAFYELELSDMSVDKTVVYSGHQYEYTNAEHGTFIVTKTCRICGHSEQMLAPSSMSVWWREPGESGSYWSNYNNDYEVGQDLSVFIKLEYPSNDTVKDWDSELDITFSDPSVAEYVQDSVNKVNGTHNQVLGRIVMLKAGTTNIRIKTKHATYLDRTYSITVHSGKNSDIKYQTNKSEMVRFIYIADLDEVATAQDGHMNVSSSMLDGKQNYDIKRVYKSVYANGKKLEAPEGKCYIISPTISVTGVSDVKTQFVIGDEDKGYNQYQAG